MKQRYKLMLGDNMELLKKIPDNSIDSVVTDAPYGLGKERDMNIILKDWIEKGYSEIEGTGFMGKEWDAYVPQPQFWKEVYRVLKPGGHILAFFGTRTYDIGTMAIRMAGFEIRDQIMWLYGSGFPKSLNIGKAVDKNQGKEIPKNKMRIVNSVGIDNYDGTGLGRRYDAVEYNVQNEYEGWGTALKPANEPICLARKPLSEKSVAENVLKWKTGGINVDGCRIGTDEELGRNNKTNPFDNNVDNGGIWNRGSENVKPLDTRGMVEGRFPANIILECICDEVIKGEKGEPRIGKRGGSVIHNGGWKKDIDGKWPNDKGDIHTNPMCPCRLLDEQSGVSKSQSGISKTKINNKEANWFRNSGGETEDRWGFGDSGGASRFFYQAKVSKAERNMGLDGFEIKINIGAIKLLIYKRKNEILWERQDLNQMHQVDMEQSHQKDTEEFITKEECVWNTELFGNYIMEKFQMGIKSIIETKTNSIMIYQTLISLIQQSTNEYIVMQQKELMDGIKFVESADKKNTKAIITYQKKDGSNQSVNPVSLKEVWSISVTEEVKSNHPTMKPINLMTYLCRLVTPKNGIILDPFMGSGSTGIAAQLEGFRFVGMEMDEEYMKIATARIENYEKYKKFIK